MSEYKQVSLENLGGGAALEQFQVELNKVLANIENPNTPADAVREITLRVKIKPSKDRAIAGVSIQATSHLAPFNPFESMFFFARRNGRVRAYESDINQPDLDGIDKNIIDMEEKTNES